MTFIYTVEQACYDDHGWTRDVLYHATSFDLAKKYIDWSENKEVEMDNLNETCWEYEKDYETKLLIIKSKLDQDPETMYED